MKYGKAVCDKALNVLREVGHTVGANKVVLLSLDCASMFKAGVWL